MEISVDEKGELQGVSCIVPEPGQLVEVRRRQWVVSDVQGYAFEANAKQQTYSVKGASLREASNTQTPTIEISDGDVASTEEVKSQIEKETKAPRAPRRNNRGGSRGWM